MDYSSPWAVGAMSVAGAGILLTFAAFQVFWHRLLRNLKQHHALETKSVHGTSVPSDRDGNSR